MTLRTLALRFRRHDWLGVAIELLVVIAGVFIALQVSNWNDERKEAVRSREYLQRLHGDMLEDAENLNAVSRFWARVRDYGESATAYAEDGVLLEGSAWKTLLAYYQASQVWPYRKPDVTFQEIRSSGDLLLIRDAQLRARISQHYSATSSSQLVEVLGLVPRYREHVRGMTPWKIQQYIWSRCYSADGSDQTLLDCDAPVSEAESLAVIERFRQSSQLTEELRFWMVNLNAGLILMQGIQAEARELSAAVQRALGQ